MHCFRQVLRSGDYLVLDNCSVHKSEGVRELLLGLLSAANVTMWYTPTYSPEVNACEFLFAQSKRYLREQRGQAPFVTELAKSFAGISKRDVYSYYYQCLERFDR